MSKREKRKEDKSNCDQHFFQIDSEIETLRQRLLGWYDVNKRTLPWRTIAESETDPNIRGYSVWVSEIMLQQTQVATVIDYYDRWMQKWPSTKALAKATLEEVNQMWSGLGYYSRGKRLFEGAQKIESKIMAGNMPRTAAQLQNDLPGVGMYTASAIASIAYGEKVGVVDGNVTRVIARLRVVGGDSTAKSTIDCFWTNARTLVDPERPGDFNQAMMELGATICTPKNPKCSECPVQDQCLAYSRVKTSKDENKAKLANKAIKMETILTDVEDCQLCLPKCEKYDSSEGVVNYPRKSKKTSKREETSKVAIVKAKDTERYLLLQRPETGLLANLLEFPSFPNSATLKSALKTKFNTNFEVKETLGEVLHIFSHIRQTYEVNLVFCDSEFEYNESNARWLSEEEINRSAISTAMKKVFQLTKNSKKRKRGEEPGKDRNKQKKITSFFLN